MRVSIWSWISLGSYNVGIQFPYEENRDSLKLTLSSLDTETTDKNIILLDLDYFLTKPETIKPNNAILWVKSAHAHLEKAFEATITDKLRQTFGER